MVRNADPTNSAFCIPGQTVCSCRVGDLKKIGAAWTKPRNMGLGSRVQLAYLTKLTAKLPKELAGNLPTVKQIEQELSVRTSGKPRSARGKNR